MNCKLVLLLYIIQIAKF